jgi:hypothetical protein
MPAPQADMMKQLARTKFMGFQLRVPDGWQDPSGDPQASHYGKAFKASEKASSPGMPPLFTPASLNKYHTDTQKMLIGKIGTFMDNVCTALCSAWSNWQSTATMVGFVVMGPTIMGGQLLPIPLMPLILPSAPMNTENEMKYSQAIAQTISTQWTAMCATITLAAPFPSHPMFAAFTLPVVPPPGIPNQVPVPMASMPIAAPLVSCDVMKPMMMAALGDPKAQYASNIFEAICFAFEQCFTLWKSTSMLNNIMGLGGVPTWTPLSPAGPVIGTATMLPGGIT